MELQPIRLTPGRDLRESLRECLSEGQMHSAFVVCGIGSLVRARLRFAGQSAETLLAGPLELISLTGTLTNDGAHLHASVSTAAGSILGGHVCFGCEIRTTAEILLAKLEDWELTRQRDDSTGHKELVVRPGKRPTQADTTK